MARTKAADYDDRRQAILDKAADLFARSGFLGASILDLSIACGMSKSLLYHYYSSKEEVLYAVMLSHIDSLIDAVEEVDECPSDPEQRFFKLLLLFMDRYVGAASKQKVLLNDLDNLPEEKRAVIVGKQRQLVSVFQRTLEQMDPSLKRNPTLAKVKTMLVFGMINWTGNWYDPEGPAKPRQIAEMVLEMAVRDGKTAEPIR
jgi:AcrR family transcriptional regulator